MALVLAMAPFVAEAKKASPCQRACAGNAAPARCRQECSFLRPPCGKNQTCRSAAEACAIRCAKTWPAADDAKSRRDCSKKCKKCLTRKGTRGLCPVGRDLRCCGGPGEPACCGAQCCGASELCCFDIDPTASRCVDPLTDAKNCRVCNRICANDQDCVGGSCVDKTPTCPAGTDFCGSLNNTAGVSGCCETGQLCCPLALAAWLCSPAGGKCCDFAGPQGVVQYPCPSDHTCCGGPTPSGGVTVGCCPPGSHACGVGSDGTRECQLQ